MLGLAAVLLAVLPQGEAQGPTWRVLAEEVGLRLLVDIQADARRIPIAYDASRLAKQVRIRSGEGISLEELWTTTNRLLADEGLACIRIAGQDGLSIVSLEQAPGLARVETGDIEESDAGFVKVLRPLPRTGPQPTSIVDATKKVFRQDGSSTVELVGSDFLLLAGLKPQVLEAERVLDSLEAAATATEIHEVEVRHIDAVSMAALLEQISQKKKSVDQIGLRGAALANPSGNSVLVIATSDDAVRWAALIEELDRAETVLTREYTPDRFGLAETAKLLEELFAGGGKSGGEWRLVVDDLTGTLIVRAPYSVHQEILGVMERLGRAGTPSRMALRSYPVIHRGVGELVDLLNGIMDAGAITEAVAAQAAPPPVASLGQLTLSADEATGCVVAYGETAMLNELARLLESLDRPHPQVLIEVLVVSLNDSEMNDFGVELRKAGVRGDLLGQAGSLFGLGGPELDKSVPVPPAGSGFSGVVLDPGNFSAVVRALTALNEGRALTIPKVLVANHAAATLDSVLQTPYLSTSATTTIATTGLGGTSDAGTSVTVTPHLTQGDRLRLEVTVSISSFVGESSDPALPPPRQENRLQSEVHLPDGHTVVLGGLEIQSESRASSRVPLLGDLPLLGLLFRSTSTSVQESRFFVFLRCTALRKDGFEDLRYLSGVDARTAGIEPDVPRLKPRIIR